VLNAASDLLVDVLGEAGRHTRAAVGASSLPFSVTVEIAAVTVVRTR
jgi:enamine deaminase RidA (YjgF/YER057c/UK114 family)